MFGTILIIAIYLAVLIGLAIAIVWEYQRLRQTSSSR
jgi:hypothetical protein